jgi:hypothetical protein
MEAVALLNSVKALVAHNVCTHGLHFANMVFDLCRYDQPLLLPG